MEPVNIGARRELFVDNYLVEKWDGGADFQLHEPVPREIVLTGDQPWEGNTCGQIAVVQDSDRIRMYYKAHGVEFTEAEDDREPQHGDAHNIGIAYAESSDGVNWTKPELNLVEFNGSKANNLVWLDPGPSPTDISRWQTFFDTNPDCIPEAQYKALGMPRRAVKYDLYAMQSPDGIHWSKMHEAPVIRNYKFDSPNTAFYDPQIGKYRAYFRHHTEENGRDIFTAESDDFLNWTEGRPLQYPGGIPTQLYTNNIHPYYRAPHIYLGFPTRYKQRQWSNAIEALPELGHRRLRANRLPRLGSALTDNLFMASRDGETFRRWDEAFVRPGPQQQGNWAYGDNYMGWGMIETPSAIEGAPPELSFYATENYWREPGAKFRRYTLRIDGFVSIRAPLKGGEFITRPLTFDGNALSLNMATSAAGSLQVGIQDESGNTFEGYSIEDCDEVIGDELDRTVTWNGSSDVSSLAGTPVRLRFILSDADLYAMQFKTAEQ